jgi:ceramide glucosyltransferase
MLTVTIGHFLRAIGVLGLLCSTGFLVLVLVAVVRFLAGRKRHPDFWPAVTLLKPLHGMEPHLLENLESFFQQDYPEFEIIFGTRDETDPALALVALLRRKYPDVPVRVAFSGEPDRPNAKVCSLERMLPLAATDYFIFSDSDVHVDRSYIREVVAPLADPAVGMVTCLYRGVPTGGIWSRLEALGMSVEMTAGVLAADATEGTKFALGPTMATRREVLHQIGGVGILADYCSDDYLLGNYIADLGYRVLISRYVIDHVVLNRNFRDTILHQVRWMKSTRFSRPIGHIATVLTFAMPFGLLALAGNLLLGNVTAGLALFLIAFLNRVILALATGCAVVRDRNSLRYCWLYPLRDFMGFCFWLASYVGTNIVWRGELYRLTPGGRMERVSIPASVPVPVDHLA